MIKVIQQTTSVVSDDANSGVEVPCHVADLAVDFDTLAADLALYDPASSTSPSAVICRKYVRVFFDAYLAAQQQGA